jgi:hypothetical protein
MVLGGRAKKSNPGNTIPIADAKGKRGNMRKKRYFEKLYIFDTKGNTYLIEVSLDDYDDVYDDWEHSPFKKRNIKDGFDDFIVNSSKDIPLNLNISIIFYLHVSKQDYKKETTLKAAYQNHYNYLMERIYIQRLSLYKRTISYLLLSILLLSMGHFFFWESEGIFHNVLHEGILIGGWVSLWECFTNILIRNSDLQTKYKLYKRLYNAEIRFNYIK